MYSITHKPKGSGWQLDFHPNLCGKECWDIFHTQRIPSIDNPVSGRSGFPGNNIIFSQSVSTTFSGSSHKLKFSAYARNYLVANQDLKGRMVALERTKGPSGRPGVEPPTGEVHNPKQRESTSNRCAPESGRWASVHRPHPGDV